MSTLKPYRVARSFRLGATTGYAWTGRTRMCPFTVLGHRDRTAQQIAVTAFWSDTQGTLTTTLGALTLVGEVDVRITATAAITLATMTVDAAALTLVDGQADITLGALSVVADGAVLIAGQADITLAALTVGGAAQTEIVGELDVTLGDLVVDSEAAVAIAAAASITLADLSVDGSVRVEQGAQLLPPAPPFGGGSSTGPGDPPKQSWLRIMRGQVALGDMVVSGRVVVATVQPQLRRRSDPAWLLALVLEMDEAIFEDATPAGALA